MSRAKRLSRPDEPVRATPRGAMGTRDGDFLVLENAWARVTIRRERIGDRIVFALGGDTIGEHLELNQAVRAAWRELALFERGRVGD